MVWLAMPSMQPCLNMTIQLTASLTVFTQQKVQRHSSLRKRVVTGLVDLIEASLIELVLEDSAERLARLFLESGAIEKNFQIQQERKTRSNGPSAAPPAAPPATKTRRAANRQPS